jgi:hypothetical protein
MSFFISVGSILICFHDGNSVCIILCILYRVPFFTKCPGFLRDKMEMSRFLKKIIWESYIRPTHHEVNYNRLRLFLWTGNGFPRMNNKRNMVRN